MALPATLETVCADQPLYLAFTWPVAGSVIMQDW